MEGTVNGCSTCTSTLHINFPILQQMETHQECILDANYIKVNIIKIGDNLDIQQSTKMALKSMLKKFPKLFGGCLGKLDMEPISITLKEGSKLYQGRYFNIPQAYNKLTRKETVYQINSIAYTIQVSF